MSDRWRRVGRVALIVGGLLAIPAVWALTPVPTWFAAAIGAAGRAGPAGAVGFALLYVVSGAIIVPCELMMAGAGFLYGPVWGSLLSWVCVNLCGVQNMYLGRTILRQPLSRRWREHGNPLGALDDRLAAQGRLVVALLRLPPLAPFHVISYALGLSQVRITHAMAGTAVGVIPAVVMYAVLGSHVAGLDGLAHAAASIDATTWMVVIGFTLGATAALTWVARRELRRLADPTPNPPPG